MDLERIRNLREDMDLTQNQIAEVLHVSQRSYSGYETGYRQMSIEMLDKLADYYKTSTDYLLKRTDVKIPYPKLKK